MRARLATALRLYLGVPSLAELERVRRELAEVRGLLTAFAAEREAHAEALPEWSAEKNARWVAADEHLLATCRAWLAAGHPLEQEAADEVVRRGRAGRAALDEALRRLWRCS